MKDKRSVQDLLNEWGIGEETLEEANLEQIDTMGLIKGYADLADDYDPKQRKLRMVMKNAASGRDMASLLKQIAKTYEEDTYNEFRFSQTASLVSKYPNLAFKFGREGSPVLFAFGGSEDEMAEFMKAAKKLRPDEIGWWDGMRYTKTPDPNHMPRNEIRLWWD